MKKAWRLFAKLPIAIIFYLLYILLCWRVLTNILWFHKQVKLHPENSGIANGGEVIGWSWLCIVLVAVTFIVIALINIPFRKGQHPFYLWLCLAIILPLIILVNI
jgi:hypothetical protein